MSDTCCGSEDVRLLYTCSGAADVGEIADRAVRKLWKEGFAGTTCLAGVGGDIPGFVQSAKGADRNITLDGCPMACAKKTLERIGVIPDSYVVTKLGYKKGETPATDEVIESVAAAVKTGVTMGISINLKPVKPQTGGCACGGVC